MRSLYSLCVVAGVVVTAGLPGAAQQSAAAGQMTAALTTEGREIVLPVTVLDQHGKLATGLTAGDFTLTDNGQTQPITSFTRESNLPFQLGLLVETSGRMLNAMASERTAAEKFVGLMLPASAQNAQPHNEAFLIHYDREVEMLQDFTNSSAKLDQELEQMGPTAGERNNPQGPDTMDSAEGGAGEGGPPSLRGGRVGNTTLYDAIYLACNQIMKSKHGRKALVVFSDGVDRGSIETLNEAIDAAERAHVALYTIYFSSNEGRNQNSFPGMGRRGGMGGGYPGGGYPGGGYPGGGYPGGYPGGGYPGGGRTGGGHQVEASGRKIMEQISRRTGGLYFVAKKPEDLEGIYNLVAEGLHGQYLLTYMPSSGGNSGGWHNVTLKPKKGKLLVVTPEAYYAPGRENNKQTPHS